MRRALGFALTAALLAGSASAQDSGPIPEAQPLLTQGTIALAVIPREMTVIERAAVATMP